MYKNKYLKYKLKYLDLKKKGGSIIIKNDLNDINYTNLEDLIKNKKKFLLCVYAPWCIYCTQFIDSNDSDYKILLNDLKEIYKIDGHKYMDEIKESNKLKNFVIGFPTILKIEDGEIILFDNNRTIKELKEFYN